MDWKDVNWRELVIIIQEVGNKDLNKNNSSEDGDQGMSSRGYRRNMYFRGREKSLALSS
jgi:hypothetical protein